MANSKEQMDEIRSMGSPYDVLRRKYLRELFELTGRNVIIYYSGWLQKPGIQGTEINDDDKNGFMSAINKMERKFGLDLLLHTPGGNTAAVESLVDYLRSVFNNDIRVIIPQIAMSGGTMIACAANEIIMGKHSSLGPVDPQFNGIPAHGVIEEFNRAYSEILIDPEDPSKIDHGKVAVWQPILSKYTPTLIGECDKAIAWSEELVREWLKTGMLASAPESELKINQIVEELTNHSITLSHGRHLSASKCKSIGLNILMLEDNQELQDAVLNVHHACILTLTQTAAFKIIENHKGIANIKIQQQILIEQK